ncbi:hypothetical protein Q0Z83_057070 [Actinoplanes sichuanensis]|uniref:Uncharacterized protein n=1 Tax=Actinoplanes sichuanensis TaxID=512349 RepID=A0ABW4A688_9ACTN|nr:hypothetical protein [Actinoplanes sichuanensis]BEL07516.1 hypothetical protein Q0Z83_057070 [Actinoplanes sichuanensis]
MATTSDPDVTVLDRRLRLSLLDRTGSDDRFAELVDQALAEALTSAGNLPQVLYLTLLRAGLAAAPRSRPQPFAPEGTPAPVDEQETCLREIRARWSTHTHRHLYPTPAAWLRALPPPAPLAGNPYSLARLLRAFTGHLASTDCGAAASLAALIEDPGEAAVAQCALVGAGLAAHDLDREAQAWARQRHLLTRMPSWTWPGGRTGHDRDVVAYLRPDHRARFDTAIGMLPYSAALGFSLLTDLPELAAAYQGTYACHGSAVYTEQRLRGRRPDPEAAAVHDEVRRDPAAAGPIVAAVVSANEQVLGAAELPLSDPVYRLSARITARTTRAHRLGADDLTPEPVPDGFDPRRLPAYAEIVRQNADTPIVAALAARIRAEAAARDDREALLILADAGYTDPDPLLNALSPLISTPSPLLSAPSQPTAGLDQPINPPSRLLDSPDTLINAPSRLLKGPDPLLDWPAPQSGDPAPRSDDPAPQSDDAVPRSDDAVPRSDDPAPPSADPAPPSGDPFPLIDGPVLLPDDSGKPGRRKWSGRSDPAHRKDGNGRPKPRKQQRRYEEAPLYPETSILLFRHRPAEAVRRVAAAAHTDWSVAAAMLEHAIPELLATAGPRIAQALHEAVVRAAICAAPLGEAPPAVIDGVYPSIDRPWPIPAAGLASPEPTT